LSGLGEQGIARMAKGLFERPLSSHTAEGDPWA
jgi:hypothetical protein